MWSAHQNPAHRKATGLHYSMACTWEFNFRLMSLSNKSSTGKAAFQIPSISWVDNRSGLTIIKCTHLSRPSSRSIHPGEPTPSCLRPSHVQSAPRETEQSSVCSWATHTKGFVPFPSLAFLWRQGIPRGSSRMNEWGLICLHLHLLQGLPAGSRVLLASTQQRIQMQETEQQKLIFKGQCFA